MYPRYHYRPEAWPPHGLEAVISCPICDSEHRHLLYANLQDWVFFCAPGKWSLYRCEECGTGYLDPRPTEDTIHLAYKNYFTHKSTDTPSFSLSHPFSRVFANGYRNWRYGTNEKPSSNLGIILKFLQPARRAQIDSDMRHIPRPWPGARLLDLGCGNGQFLTWARDMGWQVVGIDPDPEAVRVAKQNGLDVRLGGLETILADTERFDIITLCHVIEHLHSPQVALGKCFDLLKRNGTIWLETPNLDSIGHSNFGPHWRGLEPPRHLVLFTHASMHRALQRAGFTNIQDQPFRPQCRQIFAASKAITIGRNPQEQYPISLGDRWYALKMDRNESKHPTRREFLTLTANK